MPRLNNARHERFAQGLASGKTADQAYKDAGFKPSRSAASRLSANVNIKARVTELQVQVAEKTAERLAVDAAWVLDRIVDNTLAAMQDGERNAAFRGLELLGKHFSLFDKEAASHTATPEPAPTYTGNVVAIDANKIRQKGRG